MEARAIRGTPGGGMSLRGPSPQDVVGGYPPHGHPRAQRPPLAFARSFQEPGGRWKPLAPKRNPNSREGWGESGRW